jgi:hypothetical protein
MNPKKEVAADACRVVALGAKTGEEVHYFRFAISDLRGVHGLRMDS